MASATKLFKSVPTTTYQNIEDGVSLKLSKAEALTLAVVLANVGGATRETARGYAKSISDALNSAGVNYEQVQLGDTVTKDGLYFRPGSKELIDKAVAQADATIAIGQIYTGGYAEQVNMQQAAYINEAKQAVAGQVKQAEENLKPVVEPYLGPVAQVLNTTPNLRRYVRY